ncbi:MAG: lipoprotein [Xanthomonadaceae bacterium]|nr:lipoprotein [Xanthomonadaceae bacterium]
MNRRFSPRLNTLLLALALPFALAACGNKGPLVMPDRPTAGASTEAPAEAPAEATPAPAPAETPVEAPAADTPPPPPGR